MSTGENCELAVRNVLACLASRECGLSYYGHAYRIYRSFILCHIIVTFSIYNAAVENLFLSNFYFDPLQQLK